MNGPSYYACSLPNEITLEILDHAHSSSLADSTLPSNDFPVIASRVCRRWRTLLLGHTTFWSNVRIRLWRPKDLDKAQVYLARSGRCSLDVTIDSGTAGTVDVRQVHHAMYLLIPNISRWRRFVALVDSVELVERVISVLRERRAELLETFELHNVGTEEGCFIPFNLMLRALSQGTPKLRGFCIGNIFLEHIEGLQGVSSLLQGLSTLELYSSGGDAILQHIFNSLLEASPRLENLVLYGFDVLAPPAAQEVEPPRLSALRRLCIGWFPQGLQNPDANIIRQPWTLVTAPCLHDLKVVGQVRDYLRFLSRTAQSYPSITSLTFDHRSYVSRNPRPTGNIFKIIVSFPNLQHLTVVSSRPRFLANFLTCEDVDPEIRRMLIKSFSVDICQAQRLLSLLKLLRVSHLRLLSGSLQHGSEISKEILDSLAARVCRLDLVPDGIAEEKGCRYLQSRCDD
jgi:hypothetical protein